MEFFLRQVYPWLIEVSSYSSLLPFVIGLILFRKNGSLKFRLLLVFVAIGVASEVVAQITVLSGTRNNLWVGHLATPLEFGALAAIYYHSFNRPAFKKSILLAVGFIVLLSVYNALMLEGITQMNSAPKMIASSLLILFAIVYFYKVANDHTTLYLDRDPIFLLSCGVLIYYAGTTMSWALFNHALAVSYDAARICLTIVLILNILFNASQAFILRRIAA